MVNITGLNRYSWKMLAFCLCSVFLLLTKAEADNALANNLSGEPFSDPSVHIEMSPEWEKQPVQYYDSDKGADVVISLEQQFYPVLLPVIEKYAKDHDLNIVVREGTCGITAGLLSRKAVDVGGYCCAPGSTDRLPGLRFHTLGITAIALIVHTDNPINNITLDEARRIFMGEIYRWSELKVSDKEKGPNMPIQPVARLHCKTRAGHWRLLLDNEDMFSPVLQEVGVIPDMIAKIAVKRRAIGYETMMMVNRYEDKGRVKALSINGHDPDEKSYLLSGGYPLYRVYSLTTWEDRSLANSKASKLVDYLMEEVERSHSRYDIIPASQLRKAGWKFNGDELVGEPEQ